MLHKIDFFSQSSDKSSGYEHEENGGNKSLCMYEAMLSTPNMLEDECMNSSRRNGANGREWWRERKENCV